MIMTPHYLPFSIFQHTPCVGLPSFFFFFFLDHFLVHIVAFLFLPFGSFVGIGSFFLELLFFFLPSFTGFQSPRVFRGDDWALLSFTEFYSVLRKKL